MIRLKRAYEAPSRDDGFRVLVDRLWPRRLTKEDAKVDLWLKEIGPSAGLRKWFGHDPLKWKEFKVRYKKELHARKDLIEKIEQIEKEREIVTLVYSAKDENHNNALVLAELLGKGSNNGKFGQYG